MIKGYLRHRRGMLALYAAVAVLFPAVQALYGMPMEPVAYALLLVTFLLVVGGIFDCLRYSARARALDEVLENLSDAAHALPEAVGPIEARYHHITSELYLLLDAQAEEMTRRHGEQLNYYTLWVHQIKTPIAAMRLALQKGARPATLETELFKVERYVEMALQFIKMRDLSGDLIIEEYAISRIVSQSVRRYAPLFIGKRLKATIDETDLVVTTDSRWLSFILEQLLSNAVKYTDKGGVFIYTEGSALVVADTGVGIRAEDLTRIFEKGYTGFNGRLDQRASGLGLYMAQRVAGQLGIRIYPESTPGKGTSMTLVFPPRKAMIE
ncbi:sensor histidine kinase [Eubacteriales bacterium OttesenSCG-928-A19]|nr:sensor histidine kinase [Eubacteriales bacterium OttesenSCG-928-A19]